jgi:two-component system nitrate/nitrite response regulator NarL
MSRKLTSIYIRTSEPSKKNTNEQEPGTVDAKWIPVPNTKTKHKESEPIRILIADDHAMFRAALRTLLETEPQFVVVGESSDGDEALEDAVRLTPDILLLDLNMPRMLGLHTLRDLAKTGSSVRIIILTAEIERPQIVEALLLGASGLIMKDTPSHLLFKALRVVMSGQYWIGRESVNDLVQTLRDFAVTARTQQRKDKFGLTGRELEIVRAVSAGETNKDIASRFSISEQTVKHHLTRIYHKVGVSQRRALALFALSNLVESEPEVELPSWTSPVWRSPEI